MESSKSLGRITGILLLVHLTGGLMLPYILMQPALAAPGFLENAAGNAVWIRAAVLLLFTSGGITVAVALTTLPVFRRYGDRLAIPLVVPSAARRTTRCSRDSVRRWPRRDGGRTSHTCR